MNTNYWDNCYQGVQSTSASDYDGWLSGYEAYLKPGSRVLDLGCGAGTNLETLISCGAKVTAADFSPNAVELIRNTFGSRLQSADCFDMREGFPYPDGSFDAVIADLSLHYFSWEDTRRIIAETARILRDGGALIARVHSIHNLDSANAEKIEYGYYRVYGYTRRYFTMDDIRRLFCEWKLSSAEAIANRYDRQKKVIEFAAEKLSEGIL